MPRSKKKVVNSPMTFPGEGDIVLDKQMSANDPYIGLVEAERAPGERGILGPQEAVDRLDTGLGKDDMGPGGATDRGGLTPGGDVGPGPQLGYPPGTGTDTPPPPTPPADTLPRRGTGPGTVGPPPRVETPPVEEPKAEVKTTVDVITAIPTPILPGPAPARAGGAGGGAAGGAKEEKKKKKFPWWVVAVVAAAGVGAWYYYKKKK